MCEVSECGVPVDVIEATIRAWREFKKRPDDWGLFDNLDWCVKIMAIRWDSYRDARLCAAGAEWSRQVAPSAKARVSAAFPPGGHRRDK
jgi:hypothetical protein